MTEQTTALEIIEYEKQKVRVLAKLTDNTAVVLNDDGWDSRVYSFHDNAYFVKFPRSEKIRTRYPAQIAALKLAASISTDIQIPKVVWEHPNNDYFGYEGVPGVALAGAVMGLVELEKLAIGKTLGEFLSQFHQLVLPGARALSVAEEVKQNQNWYEKGLPAILSYFSKAEQQALQKLVYETWPQQLTTLGAKTVLCHGDFHFENIIYSGEGRVGIIDFGDICYADHSKDFTDFGDRIIFEAALRNYDAADINMEQKIRVRENMTRVITLTARLGKRDEPGARKTADLIKEFLAGQQ